MKIESTVTVTKGELETALNMFRSIKGQIHNLPISKKIAEKFGIGDPAAFIEKLDKVEAEMLGVWQHGNDVTFRFSLDDNRIFIEIYKFYADVAARALPLAVSMIPTIMLVSSMIQEEFEKTSQKITKLEKGVTSEVSLEWGSFYHHEKTVGGETKVKEDREPGKKDRVTINGEKLNASSARAYFENKRAEEFESRAEMGK